MVYVPCEQTDTDPGHWSSRPSHWPPAHRLREADLLAACYMPPVDTQSENQSVITNTENQHQEGSQCQVMLGQMYLNQSLLKHIHSVALSCFMKGDKNSSWLLQTSAQPAYHQLDGSTNLNLNTWHDKKTTNLTRSKQKNVQSVFTVPTCVPTMS